ncbi:MAG: heavy-metal-associated domain-containing protein [Draconibacterium sp.]
MEQIKLKTDLSCKHCVMKVEPILKSTAGITDYSIDLGHPDKIVSISSEGVDMNLLIANFNKAGYIAEKL